MEKINQYDRVLLKDGREGCAVEIFGDQDEFVVDLSPSSLEYGHGYVVVKRDNIARVITRNN